MNLFPESPNQLLRSSIDSLEELMHVYIGKYGQQAKNSPYFRNIAAIRENLYKSLESLAELEKYSQARQIVKCIYNSIDKDPDIDGIIIFINFKENPLNNHLYTFNPKYANLLRPPKPIEGFALL
jgi:hypothetical protein